MSGYIGVQPVPQTTQTRESFTATAGQTSFGTSGYQIDHLDVYLNGVKLAAADYTATNGSDIVLASGAAVNDILEMVAFETFTIANQSFTGTTTVDTLVVTNTVDGRDVSVDGAKLDTIPIISTSSTPSFTAKGDGTTDGYIQLNCSQNSHGIKLKAPPHSANASYTLTFPNDDGNAGQFLKTDGSGGLSWATDSTTDSTKLPLAGGAMTGAITTNSTFDGVDVGARDVVLTDTTTKATAALPKTGGAMTGAITTNSTFDGVDVGTRDAVLTTTTNTANAALPKTGGALTGAVTTNSTFDGVDIATRDAVLTSTTTTANAALPLAGGTLTSDLNIVKTSGATLNVNTGLTGADSKILLHEGSTASPANGASIRYAGATNEFNIGVGSSVDTKRLSIARDTGDISFYEDTGSTAKFYWDASAESLGIGIAAPLAKLNIAGDTSTFDGMAKIYLTDSNSQAASRNWSIGNGGSGTGNLTFAVSAAKDGNAGNATAVNAMVINSGGNIGIGNVSPSAKLDVVTNDNVWTGEFIQQNTSNGDGVLIQVGSTAAADYALSVRSNAGNTSVIAAKADGKVGIGTFTPDSPLEVVGADSGIKISSAGSSRPHLRLESGGAEKLRLSANTAYGAIGDGSDANRYMIFKDGNMGMGNAPEATIKADIYSGSLTRPMRLRFIDDNNSNASATPLFFEYKAGLEIENSYSGAAPSANGTKVAKIQLTTVTAGGYGASGTMMAVAESNGYDAGALVFATGTNSSGVDTERMRIGQSGYVTKPNHPSFQANRPTSTSGGGNSNGGTASSGNLIFSSVDFNNGSHYATSNGKFTAPVTGYYYFSFSLLWDDSYNGTGYITVRKNNSGSLNYGYAYIQDTGSTYAYGYLQVAGASVVQLNANEFVNIYSSIPGWHIGAESTWAGFLLG